MSPLLQQFEQQEIARRNQTLNLIASENYAWPEVYQAMSSVFGDKYAEGAPGKRFYAGCDVVDQLETYAQQLACQLFGTPYANLQPHSGSSANQIAYAALLQPGDTVLAMSMRAGGHLTHGHAKNYQAGIYNFVHYELNPLSATLDFNCIADLAKQCRPKLIIAGASAYPRSIDFAAFAQIAKMVGAKLLADIAHIAGLVAAGLHPSPVGFADIITMTTQKTLRGPRGGLILSTAELAPLINRAVMPGVQGGPHLHSIFAKAVMLEKALTPAFQQYQQQIITNTAALAASLHNQGLRLLTGGSDNHLLLLDVFCNGAGISGRQAMLLLESIGITTNANLIPGDSQSPLQTSGLRLGTPALTTRGLTPAQAMELGTIIAQALRPEARLPQLAQQAQKLAQSLQAV